MKVTRVAHGDIALKRSAAARPRAQGTQLAGIALLVSTKENVFAN